jgi:hypothetical protein
MRLVHRCDGALRDAELRFLQQEIYGRLVDVPTRRITAWDRCSECS